MPRNRQTHAQRRRCVSSVFSFFSKSESTRSVPCAVFTCTAKAFNRRVVLLRLRYTYYPINKPCENVQGLRLYTERLRAVLHSQHSTSTAAAHRRRLELVPMVSSHTTTLKPTTWARCCVAHFNTLIQARATSWLRQCVSSRRAFSFDSLFRMPYLSDCLYRVRR